MSNSEEGPPRLTAEEPTLFQLLPVAVPASTLSVESLARTETPAPSNFVTVISDLS